MLITNDATVDGSEIRLTSWGWSFIPLFTRFYDHPRWLFGDFWTINSMLLWFHTMVFVYVSEKISCGLTMPRLSGSRLKKAVFRRVRHEDIQDIYNQRHDISMHKSRNDMNILCIIYIYNHIYRVRLYIYNFSRSHFTTSIGIDWYRDLTHHPSSPLTVR